MKLKKCEEHGYTLKDECLSCGEKSKDAHYKFLKIRSANIKQDERNTEIN